MDRRAANERVFELLEPLAWRHGLELVGTEIVGPGGRPTVRVYLDRDGGIDIDAIAESNAWISDALDQQPPVRGTYVLEVSSPGIERPLLRREDYDRFSGVEVVVRTAAPVDGRRRFAGVLRGLVQDEIEIEVDGRTFRVPYDAVTKAHLKANADFGDE